MTRLSAALALVAFGLSAAPAAHAQTIDPFTSGTFAYSAANGQADGGDQAAANVPGGDRTVTVYNPYNSVPFAAALPARGAGVTVGPGYALFGLSYGTRYNGGGSTVGTDATSAHLDLSHADRLRFTFTAVSGTVQIYATLQNVGGGSLSNGNPGDPSFTVSAPGTYDLPFSSLESRGGVNLADVDILSLSLQPYGGSSFTLRNLAAAPEPSSLVGLFVGVLGVGARALQVRRRSTR